MSKGSHFAGQPVYGQLINLLDKSKILQISHEKGGEKYVKHFDAWQHLLIMLYAVIKRFDSLREITNSMFPEARKFSHLGIEMMPRRSTLSDANARRPETIFEATYRDLYDRYKDELSSDSRKRQTPKWLNKLQIIDSTTITLFSSLIFKGAGRHPKLGKKKGGIPPPYPLTHVSYPWRPFRLSIFCYRKIHGTAGALMCAKVGTKVCIDLFGIDEIFQGRNCLEKSS